MRKQLLTTCLAGLVFCGTGHASASTVTVPEKWVGTWTVHAGGVTVRPNGLVTMTYQTYYKRDKGLPTFPQIRMRVTSVRDRKLTGRVVAQRQARVQTGTRFTVTQKPPGLWVTFAGSSKIYTFCDRWHRERGRCGA